MELRPDVLEYIRAAVLAGDPAKPATRERPDLHSTKWVRWITRDSRQGYLATRCAVPGEASGPQSKFFRIAANYDAEAAASCFEAASTWQQGGEVEWANPKKVNPNTSRRKRKASVEQRLEPMPCMEETPPKLGCSSPQEATPHESPPSVASCSTESAAPTESPSPQAASCRTESAALTESPSSPAATPASSARGKLVQSRLDELLFKMRQ